MTDQLPAVDLSYHDPAAPSIAVQEVVAKAKRVRRRRRVSMLTSAVAAVTAVALTGTLSWGHRNGGHADWTQVAMTDPVYQMHPASEDMIVIDAQLP
jgi:hypothetical protein